MFRKIKEMKESLIGNRTAYEQSKTIKSIYEPSRARETANDDYKIENIDKINTKIQQILSCLKDN